MKNIIYIYFNLANTLKFCLVNYEIIKYKIIKKINLQACILNLRSHI